MREALQKVHVLWVEGRQKIEQPLDCGTAATSNLQALRVVAKALLDGEVDLVDENVFRWWPRARQGPHIGISGTVCLAFPHGDHELFRQPV